MRTMEVNPDREPLDDICRGQYPDGCGAVLREYREHLSTTLVRILVAIARVDMYGPVHPEKDTTMKRTGMSNLNKLRYFGLIEQYVDQEGLHPEGYWNLTDKGRRFITGVGYCYPVVWTFRHVPVAWEGEPISIHDTIVYHELSAERYAQESRPHDPTIEIVPLEDDEEEEE